MSAGQLDADTVWCTVANTVFRSLPACASVLVSPPPPHTHTHCLLGTQSLQWSLCTQYLLARQVRVTVGDSISPLLLCPLSVERHQFPLLIPEPSKIFSLYPGGGQNMALHASPTARNYFSVSVFMALSTVFHSINSLNNSPLSHHVPPV